MSAQGYSPGAGIPFPTNGRGELAASAVRIRARYWLHALLLGLTFATTTSMGAIMAENFRLNRAAFDVERDLRVFSRVWSDPLLLASGLSFSVTLLIILLAHEFGHYLACRYYGVDASLPYFLPSLTYFGTFGAFIRIRSPIYSKRVLFDIGIAGPLAGFVFVLPALAIGLAYSKVLPGIGERGDLAFGVPPLLWVAQHAIIPGVPSTDIYLHPIARAAWAGMFSTALNLLPIGQLDGGHIVYAFLGDRAKLFSRLFLAALIPLGLLLYWPWLIWALLLLLFGLSHPLIFDSTRLDSGRRRLAYVALAIFLLCFMAAPVDTTRP